MDQFDVNEFSALNFDTEFQSFLSLPASSDIPAFNYQTTHHKNFVKSGVEDSQCPGCAKLKADLDCQDKEHRVNFQFLKKKVISTDKLIQKCKAKQEECEQQDAEIQELKKKLEQAARHSDILLQQLNTAIESVKPLQEEKERLESELKLKSLEVRNLNDKIEGERAFRCQQLAQDEHYRNLEHEVTKLKRLNTNLASKNHGLEIRVQELLCEKKGLTSSKNIAERRQENLALALKKAQDVCNEFWAKLAPHGLTDRQNKPKLIPNGLKSLIRRVINKKTDGSSSTNGTSKHTEEENVDDSENEGEDTEDDNDDGDSDFNNFDDLDTVNDADLDHEDTVTKQEMVSNNVRTKSPDREPETSVTFRGKSSDIASSVYEKSSSGDLSQKEQKSPGKHLKNVLSAPEQEISEKPVESLGIEFQKSKTENVSQNLRRSPRKPADSGLSEARVPLLNKGKISPAKTKVTPDKTALGGLQKGGVKTQEEQENSIMAGKVLGSGQQSPRKLALASGIEKNKSNDEVDGRKEQGKDSSRHGNVEEEDYTIDDSSLSSLSSLSDDSDSSEDDDEMKDPSSGKNVNKDKAEGHLVKDTNDQGRKKPEERDKNGVDLNRAFSFFNIPDMLSPIPLSPSPPCSVVSQENKASESDEKQVSDTHDNSAECGIEYEEQSGSECDSNDSRVLTVTPTLHHERATWPQPASSSQTAVSSTLSSDSDEDDDDERPGTPDFSNAEAFTSSSYSVSHHPKPPSLPCQELSGTAAPSNSSLTIGNCNQTGPSTSATAQIGTAELSDAHVRSPEHIKDILEYADDVIDNSDDVDFTGLVSASAKIPFINQEKSYNIDNIGLNMRTEASGDIGKISVSENTILESSCINKIQTHDSILDTSFSTKNTSDISCHGHVPLKSPHSDTTTDTSSSVNNQISPSATSSYLISPSEKSNNLIAASPTMSNQISPLATSGNQISALATPNDQTSASATYNDLISDSSISTDIISVVITSNDQKSAGTPSNATEILLHVHMSSDTAAALENSLSTLPPEQTNSDNLHLVQTPTEPAGLDGSDDQYVEDIMGDVSDLTSSSNDEDDGDNNKELQADNGRVVEDGSLSSPDDEDNDSNKCDRKSQVIDCSVRKDGNSSSEDNNDDEDTEEVKRCVGNTTSGKRRAIRSGAENADMNDVGTSENESSLFLIQERKHIDFKNGSCLPVNAGGAENDSNGKHRIMNQRGDNNSQVKDTQSRFSAGDKFEGEKSGVSGNIRVLGESSTESCEAENSKTIIQDMSLSDLSDTETSESDSGLILVPPKRLQTRASRTRKGRNGFKEITRNKKIDSNSGAKQVKQKCVHYSGKISAERKPQVRSCSKYEGSEEKGGKRGLTLDSSHGSAGKSDMSSGTRCLRQRTNSETLGDTNPDKLVNTMVVRRTRQSSRLSEGSDMVDEENITTNDKVPTNDKAETKSHTEQKMQTKRSVSETNIPDKIVNTSGLRQTRRSSQVGECSVTPEKTDLEKTATNDRVKKQMSLDKLVNMADVRQTRRSSQLSDCSVSSKMVDVQSAATNERIEIKSHSSQERQTRRFSPQKLIDISPDKLVNAAHMRQTRRSSQLSEGSESEMADVKAKTKSQSPQKLQTSGSSLQTLDSDKFMSTADMRQTRRSHLLSDSSDMADGQKTVSNVKANTRCHSPQTLVSDSILSTTDMRQTRRSCRLSESSEMADGEKPASDVKAKVKPHTPQKRQTRGSSPQTLNPENLVRMADERRTRRSSRLSECSISPKAADINKASTNDNTEVKPNSPEKQKEIEPPFHHGARKIRLADKMNHNLNPNYSENTDELLESSVPVPHKQPETSVVQHLQRQTRSSSRLNESLVTTRESCDVGQLSVTATKDHTNQQLVGSRVSTSDSKLGSLFQVSRKVDHFNAEDFVTTSNVKMSVITDNSVQTSDVKTSVNTNTSVQTSDVKTSVSADDCVQASEITFVITDNSAQTSADVNPSVQATADMTNHVHLPVIYNKKDGVHFSVEEANYVNNFSSKCDDIKDSVIHCSFEPDNMMGYVHSEQIIDSINEPENVNNKSSDQVKVPVQALEEINNTVHKCETMNNSILPTIDKVEGSIFVSERIEEPIYKSGDVVNMSNSVAVSSDSLLLGNAQKHLPRKQTLFPEKDVNTCMAVINADKAKPNTVNKYSVKPGCSSEIVEKKDMQALPSLDVPALSSLDVPALPSLDKPAVPKLDVPVLPSLDKPALPNLNVPASSNLNLPSLSDVFEFFIIPPLLSPLPATPPPSVENIDWPVAKFSRRPQQDALKVMPRTRVESGASGQRLGSLSSQMLEANKLLGKRRSAAQAKPKPVTGSIWQKPGTEEARRRGQKREADDIKATPSGQKRAANVTQARPSGQMRAAVDTQARPNSGAGDIQTRPSGHMPAAVDTQARPIGQNQAADIKAKSSGQMRAAVDTQAMPNLGAGDTQTRPSGHMQAAVDTQARPSGQNQVVDDIKAKPIGQKRVADDFTARPNKKRKLADISGHPSAFAAIMHDLNMFLAASDVNVKATIETMLTRLEEENTKALWDLLCQVIIKYLASVTQEDLMSCMLAACGNKGEVRTVFISDVERRLVCLISSFLRMDKELDRCKLLSMIWTAIFSRDCGSELVRLSHCRMFSSLFMEQGDLEQARILAYNIARCDHLDLVRHLLAIVGVWPEVIGVGYNVNQSCVRMVLKFMLKEKCIKDKSLFDMVCLVMQRVCQLDLAKADDPPEELLKNLVDQLQHRVQNVLNGTKVDNTFEAMKAVELLLIHQGPEWVEKNFVKRTLVSAAMRWENKSQDKPGPPDLFVDSLLKIFRALMSVQPPSNITVNIVLGTVFSRFLKSSKACDIRLELTCLEAVMELAPFNPEKSLELLKTWQESKKGNIPPEIFSKLQQVRNLVSRGLPPVEKKKKKQNYRKMKSGKGK